MLACVMLCRPAAAEVVDRILHVVGSRVITASDVAFERIVAVHDRSPVPALADPTVDVETRLIDYAVLREFAGDANIYRPDPREVRKRYVAFQESFATPDEFDAFMADWGLDELKLQGFFSSRMAVERYAQRNHRGELATRTDAWLAWLADLRARTTIRSPS